ncbi:hypothetical protein NDU88_002511 [Pleurodeles waltl]|uniref:Uncharacterized protein n=1 Tax=Pleurodeles waltl TaxID=8319 RepID=A0AAV7M1T4_PLEWA|nr:hypothetical protein NDU88_002511 [Pleurodeles waltl]
MAVLNGSPGSRWAAVIAPRRPAQLAGDSADPACGLPRPKRKSFQAASGERQGRLRKGLPPPCLRRVDKQPGRWTTGFGPVIRPCGLGRLCPATFSARPRRARTLGGGPAEETRL